MHNMIIESESIAIFIDDPSYNEQGPITDVDHQVPTDFTDLSLCMRKSVTKSLITNCKMI